MTYISRKLRQQIEKDAGQRCGYCLSDETLSGIPLSIEHIIPESSGGETTRENLWLTCRPCNEIKGVQTTAPDPETGNIVPVFHPRQQKWDDHFSWSEDGTNMIGETPEGRATIEALRLNRSLLVKARRRWVFAGWHPPK